MSLSKSAMLVSVAIVNGGLLGERKDPIASNLVQTTYGTADRRTKASKYLIDRQHKSVKRVVAASQRVREVVYKYTLPWGDDKVRVLAIKLESAFRHDLELAIHELKHAREDYIHAFPALVSASERDLAELFDRSQYPGTDRIRDLFKTKVVYWPIPESNHFVADVSADAAKEAKESIEHEIEERLLEATYDMVRRAKEVVTAFVDKVSNLQFDEDGKPLKGTGFTESLVGNIRDQAHLIERMNLTNNPQITKVVKDLNRIVTLACRASFLKDASMADGRKRALTAGQEVLANLTMLDLKDQEVSDMVDGTSDYLDL